MKKVVLVMDDSAIVLDTLRFVLEAHGFDVRTAVNLVELEAQCASKHLDLFILDVQMPEAFGDEVAEVLREVRKMNAPVLLFSSLEESALEARARDAAVDGYVSKNAGVDALVSRVRAMLRDETRA